tara:strand:+ start:669 stop:3161 length:2493 start_codon:yes stop_codon:yes gene_type:complete
MVQIPTFTSKNNPQQTSGVIANIPNIDASIPYRALSRIGDNIANIGTNLYQEQLSQENKLLEQQKRFDLATLRTESQADIDKHRIKEQYKTRLFEHKENLKTDYAIAEIKLDRNRAVDGAMNNLLEPINQLQLTAINNPDVDTALKEYDDNIKLLVEKELLNITDPVAKDIFKSKFEDWHSRSRVNVTSGVRKKKIEIAIANYDKKIENLQYDFVHGNEAQSDAALQTLLHPTDSIFHEMADASLLSVPVDVAQTEAKYQLFALKSEHIVDTDPNLWMAAYNEGEWKELLKPEIVNDHFRKADNKIKAEIKANETALNSQASSMMGLLKDEKWILNNVAKGNVPRLREMLEMATNNNLGSVNPELIPTIEAYIQIVDEALTFRQMPEMVMENHIANIVDQHNQMIADGKPISIFEAERLKVLRAIQKDTNTRIKDDAISLAIDHGVIGNESERNTGFDNDNLDIIQFFNIDNEEQFQQIIDKRINQALHVQSNYALPSPQFFTQEERDFFKEIFDEAESPSDIIGLASRINDSFGEHALDVFKEISPKNAIFSYIGAYVNNGNLSLATDVAKGHFDKKNGIVKSFKQGSAFQTYFYNHFKDSLIDNNIDGPIIREVVENAIIAQGRQKGWFVGKTIQETDTIDITKVLEDNEDAVFQIMNEAVGATYVQNKLVAGGVIDYNDKKIILPTDFPRTKIPGILGFGSDQIDENEFNDIIQHVFLERSDGMALLLKAGNNELPMSSFFENVNSEEPSDRTLTIEEIFGSGDTKPLFWTTIAPGQYTLSLFDPATTNEPNTYWNATTNQAWVLDLNKVMPEIIDAFKATNLVESD